MIEEKLRRTINAELVKWLDGTKVPGAIVVTNDFAEKLTKKIEAHYKPVIEEAKLALVVDLEAKTGDGEWLSIWIKNQYAQLSNSTQTKKGTK